MQGEGRNWRGRRRLRERHRRPRGREPPAGGSLTRQLRRPGLERARDPPPVPGRGDPGQRAGPGCKGRARHARYRGCWAEELNAIAPGRDQPNIPPFLLGAGLASDWMLPGPIALDSLTVILVPYHHKLPGSVSVGILNSKEQITEERQVRVVGSGAELNLHGRPAYGIRVEAASGTPAAVGAVAVTTARPWTWDMARSAAVLVLNGILQGVLEPPHWRYQTDIGGLPVFTNTFTRGAAWLEPAGSESALVAPLPGAGATTPSVEPWQDPVTLVSTPRPAVLVRSAAYASELDREAHSGKGGVVGDRGRKAARHSPGDLGPAGTVHRDVALRHRLGNNRAARQRPWLARPRPLGVHAPATVTPRTPRRLRTSGPAGWCVALRPGLPAADRACRSLSPQVPCRAARSLCGGHPKCPSSQLGRDRPGGKAVSAR